MSPGLTIREAGLTDLKSVFAIEKESFPTPWSRWTFLAELNQSLGHFLVAGPSPPLPWELWGYIVFWLVADEMHLLNLAVHPEKRRRGVARFLLQEALRRSRTLGAKAAWLEVRPSNIPALALYASFGFREVGRRPGYYQDTREDAILLVLEWEEEG
ncbi:MAG: ribosomal protein S18-alanine N-acetyltransferase [Desulfobaccales bacterium]